MQDMILRVTDMQKNYRHIRALQGASLGVRRGGITAIVGDNGSGKSTLIKILSGNIKPDGGTIEMDGQSYGSLNVKEAMRLGVRTVYQDLSLDNYKNSVENIFLGAELMRGPFLNRKAMREEAAAILQSINVTVPDLDEPVRNLSGGQRQGVAIARALRTPGKLLLLDEPTAAMGIQESHSALNILRGLREKGMSQLIISHNIHQVFGVADYIYVMRSGRCIAGVSTADTTPQQLQELILSRENQEVRHESV